MTFSDWIMDIKVHLPLNRAPNYQHFNWFPDPLSALTRDLGTIKILRGKKLCCIIFFTSLVFRLLLFDQYLGYVNIDGKHY